MKMSKEQKGKAVILGSGSEGGIRAGSQAAYWFKHTPPNFHPILSTRGTSGHLAFDFLSQSEKSK